MEHVPTLRWLMSGAQQVCCDECKEKLYADLRELEAAGFIVVDWAKHEVNPHPRWANVSNEQLLAEVALVFPPDDLPIV